MGDKITLFRATHLPQTPAAVCKGIRVKKEGRETTSRTTEQRDVQTDQETGLRDRRRGNLPPWSTRRRIPGKKTGGPRISQGTAVCRGYWMSPLWDRVNSVPKKGRRVASSSKTCEEHPERIKGRRKTARRGDGAGGRGSGVADEKSK